MVLPRGISLDNCEQFSIVKLQDKRDPSGRSLVMVQTNEPGYRPDRLEAPGRRQALPGAKVLRKVVNVHSHTANLYSGISRYFNISTNFSFFLKIVKK